MTLTIGIFPASGGLGTSTYTHLLKLVPNNTVVLVNRYPEKVPQSYIDAGVRVRKASYESTPSELNAAFSDIDVLFLISYPSHVHDYRTKASTIVHIRAVDAAKSAGVTHIFYSSLGFAGDYQSTSLAEVMQAHLDTERYLAKLADEDNSSPLTYISIREGLYAESTPIYTAFFDPRQPKTLHNGEICIPHDGSGPGVAWVKRDELGEASARLIASYAKDKSEFPFKNHTVLLTGSRAWSLSETVQVLAGIAGRELKIREVSVDEYAKLPRVRECFGSEELARTWATAWDAIRAGETAVVTPELEGILGRKSEAFEVAVREHFA
ncbi:Quinone oxidoreductase 2 [Madurella mycetomatis]|uniref:Quinone oxidoreductase 2 n=1 Tax=Madurella mycetomatis TaxID=100816 RepID=A0A175VV48_9PEZI|nr:Quinone oxidoreductase 2 [Madurella mycetomatis]